MRQQYQHAPWYAVVALACISVVVWTEVVGAEHGGRATVAFLDVGQGDAILVEAENGNRLLIDGGADASVLRELGGLMRPGERHIDVVMATHPDLDHIGGLPDVFERYDVGMFLEPGVADDGNDYRALLEAVREAGLEPVYARTGMSLTLSPTVRLDILFPDRDVAGLEANSGSVVARLVCGTTSFLLTGDSPASIEEYLVSTQVPLQSDVLKLGHHGSRTSTSEAFLSVVAPTTVVVSVGCDNRYGHPHEEVLARLRTSAVLIRSTCTDGTVVLTCGA